MRNIGKDTRQNRSQNQIFETCALLSITTQWILLCMRDISTSSPVYGPRHAIVFQMYRLESVHEKNLAHILNQMRPTSGIATRDPIPHMKHAYHHLATRSHEANTSRTHPHQFPSPPYIASRQVQIGPHAPHQLRVFLLLSVTRKLQCAHLFF